MHLQADMRAVIEWAKERGRRWAFSNCNAGAKYVVFYKDLRRLDEVNWAAVDARDFRNSTIKEGKQAEFLLHESFPWQLIEKVGVFSDRIAEQVRLVVTGTRHGRSVAVERGWYY